MSNLPLDPKLEYKRLVEMLAVSIMVDRVFGSIFRSSCWILACILQGS